MKALLIKTARVLPPIKNDKNPLAGKRGFPPPPRKPRIPTQDKVKKRPRVKSSSTQGTLPMGKVNMKPEQ